MARSRPSFTESELRAAVADSQSFSDVLRRLELRAAGGNHSTIKKYVARWAICTAHFDPAAWRRTAAPRNRVFDEILVEHSTYTNRRVLKKRLYAAGLKAPACELCGQGEVWRGKHMSLILDHLNGVHDDNRLENLRIVCPNCNATLDTHCGKRTKVRHPERACRRCGSPFEPKTASQRYCSRACGARWDRTGRPLPAARRAVRPPREELLRAIGSEGYEAVGRRHGVSGNAIRKWVGDYEERAARTA